MEVNYLSSDTSAFCSSHFVVYIYITLFLVIDNIYPCHVESALEKLKLTRYILLCNIIEKKIAPKYIECPCKQELTKIILDYFVLCFLSTCKYLTIYLNNRNIE